LEAGSECPQPNPYEIGGGGSGGGGGKIPPIKLNELVKKPDSSDGLKPPARKWFDDYEKASEANGWSDPLLNIDHSNVIYAALSRHMQQGMEAQTLRGGADIWREKSELLHTGVQ